ncbi:MAG TPA: hypothetical protein VFT32_00810 [Candidatus Eisenbacteria bacterium]|nr:hypothetical protein [Candidatus Eisenbacteria bacterium]
MISALLTAVIPALLLPWVLIPLRLPPLFALLPMLPLAWVYARAVRDERASDAAFLAIAWAGALTVSTVAAAARTPQAALQTIWHASDFRNEMVTWIATGRGAEGNIALFLPRVLVEYALVWILSAATLGAAALLLGSLLLGYMNGYVGWVVANADPAASPIGTALVAWPPWSVARVLSFILAGTAGALWGWRRFYARRWGGDDVFVRAGAGAAVRRLALFSLFLLLLDIGLKWWLAPIWREWLHALLGASAGLEAGGQV